MIINVIIILVILIGVLSGIKTFLKRISGTGCCGGGNQNVRIEPKDKRRSHYAYRAELVVQGMKCRNCVLLVENALNSLDGVMAKVNLKKNRVLVLLKQTGNEQLLISAVASAGYTVTDIKLLSR